MVDKAKKVQYEVEHVYVDVDQQKFWDLFVDHEAWSESDLLPGVITIIEPGEGHPQGVGAVRSVVAGRLKVTEDILAFEPPGYFRYSARDGSFPVDDFGGELFLDERADGLVARYRGGFNPKYPGTGRLFRFLFRSSMKMSLSKLGKAYAATYG